MTFLFEIKLREKINQGDKLRTGDSVEAMEYLDCSEFVCRVLAYDGITKGVKAMSTKNEWRQTKRKIKRKMKTKTWINPGC